jgi:cytidylate kinase
MLADVAGTPADLAVAIDGPMGSGKSTVARELARRLRFRYVDTGAMYRAVAVAAIRRRVDPDDPAAVAALVRTITLTLPSSLDGTPGVAVDGEDVTPDLRSVEVNRIVAKIARVPEVRTVLGVLQRSLAAAGQVVMEGRDIGSVILPQAQIKVFLTASPETRARRRQHELAAAGTPLPLSEVRRILDEDDRIASTRQLAPLRLAPGAVVIDSTELSVDQVVAQIASLVNQARGL